METEEKGAGEEGEEMQPPLHRNTLFQFSCSSISTDLWPPLVTIGNPAATRAGGLKAVTSLLEAISVIWERRRM